VSHYLIYLPGRSGAVGHLESVGLGQLEQRKSFDWMEVDSGPDGKGGVIGTVFGAPSKDEPFHGYDPSSQEWRAGPPNRDIGVSAGDWWYGFDPSRPPVPADLMHDTVMDGKDVILKDGNGWLVPESLSLPMNIGRDPETGDIRRYYTGKYEEFCKATERYVFILFENIMSLELMKKMNPGMPDGEYKTDFVFEDLWDYCCLALSINYRVCDPIAGHGFLDLFDDRKMILIAMATIAFPDILEVIEKKKVTSPVSTVVKSTMNFGSEIQAGEQQPGSTFSLSRTRK